MTRKTTEESNEWYAEAKTMLDDDALEFLLPKFMRYITWRASSYSRNGDADVLQNAGALGLWQAYQSYDPKKGASFWAHATRRILGSMLDLMRDEGATSRTDATRFKQIMIFETAEIHDKGARPSREQICEALEISDEQYWAAMTFIKPEASVDDAKESEGIMNTVESRTACTYAEGELHSAAEEELFKMTEILDLRARVTLYLRYGLGVPIRDIGKALGLSSSAMTDIHNRALANVRESLTEPNA